LGGRGRGDRSEEDWKDRRRIEGKRIGRKSIV
jgi:hypothetical protein